MRIGHKYPVFRKPWWASGLLSVAMLMCAGPASAQDDGIPTLRVYANLLQIPTLVLDWQHRPLRPIASRKFLVSIDGGPKFRVTHVRVEGEDPVSLAILVDVNQLPSEVNSKVRDAVAGLAPGSVRPEDSVSLYALGCELSRAVAEKPTNEEALRVVAELLLPAPKMSGRPRGSDTCRQRWNLLDGIGSAVRGLDQEPGRRVLLVLTDGVDHGSKLTWDALRRAAQLNGVAIFAIVPPSETSMPMSMPIRGSRGLVANQIVPAVTNLPSLCESTGGMVMEDNDRPLGTEMRDFMALVRGRYIVEFPRPAAGPGSHSLDISIEKMAAFVRPAGASVPVADPALEKDPNTILPDPKNAPEVGTKRPTR